VAAGGGEGVMSDFVLRGGEVIDGSGKQRFRADVAIEGDRIAAVGAVGKADGAREIDASGRIVAPGFIDVHTHDDRALFAAPGMAAKASQGVTTVVTGNCGVSLAPLVAEREPPPPLDLIGDAADYRWARFADYLAALDGSPAALNAACLVGHSTLRVGAMAALDRPAEPGELKRMAERLQEALDAGAVGLSSGLAYAPAAHAPPSEIEALAALLRPAGAVYTTHMRDEGSAVLDSLDESFAVGRAARVPVVISHHKTVGRANFGRTQETLPRIAAAQAAQEVGLDAYPYIASSTVLSAAQAARATRVLVTWSKSAPEMAGRELPQIAAQWGVGESEAVDRLQPAGAIYWTMDEADVQRVLRFEHTMIGSDGLPHDTHPHPRLWGTFPRVLGHYCRELGLFGLEEAVRRMTLLPARRFGLAGRGMIAAGAYADIAVFDPATVIDRATFEAPTRPAAGIEHVFVNGRPVWQGGASTGERPGRALRRQQMQKAAR
jgi:N-acyl-D-amino-acid deacylase